MKGFPEHTLQIGMIRRSNKYLHKHTRLTVGMRRKNSFEGLNKSSWKKDLPYFNSENGYILYFARTFIQTLKVHGGALNIIQVYGS